MGTYSLIAILLYLASSSSWAAACCGGGASLPSLITGDNRAQVVLSGSNAAITHDVNPQGEIAKRRENNQEVIETLSLSAAYLVSPLWQIGLTLPVKMNTHRNSFREESSAGLGDIKARVAYEFLPEYGYSKWKPRGYIYLKQSFAHSTSTYEAQKPLRSDSLGNGFSTTALGFSFVKIISNLDFLLMSELHLPFKNEFQQENDSITVRPSLGGSFLLGAGISPWNGDIRFGGTLLYSREGSREISGPIDSVSEKVYFWEGGINVSYLMDSYSLNLFYKDQSFFAKAKNTTLSKIIGLSFIKFFEL